MGQSAVKMKARENLKHRVNGGERICTPYMGAHMHPLLGVDFKFSARDDSLKPPAKIAFVRNTVFPVAKKTNKRKHLPTSLPLHTYVVVNS